MLCRLAYVIDLPLHLLTAVRVLDLSCNNDLALGQRLEADQLDAADINGMPALRVLGLRKVHKTCWNSVDMQAVNDLHHICSKLGRPAIDMVCHSWDSSRGCPDANLDLDTYFLDSVVNHVG